MEQITPNVFAETKIRGCNPGIVFTSEGAVFIDNAQLLTTFLETFEFGKSRGPIKYLINTEPHIDHIFANHWFHGVCPVVGHELIERDFFLVPGTMDGYDYSVDVLTRQDPEGLQHMPSRENYVLNPPQITFNDRMTLKVGEHHFHLYHTPGHADSQIAVHIPEERVVFVGDTVFSDCQIWLHSADIPALFRSLEFIKGLDVDYIIPGHGPVVTKEYIDQQIAFIQEWIAAVDAGKKKGWSVDECIKNIDFSDRCPVDIGQAEMMEYIQRTNVQKCYALLEA